MKFEILNDKTNLARARFLCEIACLLDHAKNNDLTKEEQAEAAIYSELLHSEAQALAGRDCDLIYLPDDMEPVSIKFQPCGTICKIKRRLSGYHFFRKLNCGMIEAWKKSALTI